MYLRCSISLFCLLAGVAGAGTLAQFRTVFGDLDVELFDQHKPVTVQNFLRYVQSGRYQDSFLHRCDPGFVIQGGAFYVVWGDGSVPPYIDAVPTFGTIANEYGAGAIYSNRYGTLAMARVGGQTNSATSQWFFNLADNGFLDGVDGGFTVFGRVVRGTNVLERFKTFSRLNTTTNLIVDLRWLLGPAFGEVPFLTANLTYADLLYVDISLLQVQVRRLAGQSPSIAWTSVVGRTNYVEYTTHLPPAWQPLAALVGTGGILEVTDPDPDPRGRFYRVRVAY